MASRTRVIGGKRYKLLDEYVHKPDAVTHAQAWRNAGYLARVMDLGKKMIKTQIGNENKYYRYVVYIRKAVR